MDPQAPGVSTPTPESAADPDPAVPAAAGAHRPARLRRDLILLGIVGALLAAAIWAGYSALNREFWGASAFAERYVGMLADGRASDALAMPGVGLDTADLEAAGLPATSSEALLRSAVLTHELTDIEAVSETWEDGVVTVEVRYLADGAEGTTSFRIERDGTEGLVPRWSFASSPLSVLDLTVHSSMQFTVNGFEIDKRQVSPDGAEADPVASVPMLVFSPGIYSIGVDTAIATADEVNVLADAPLSHVPLELQAKPTDAFAGVVEDEVASFLERCTTQKVLQPTGCPFGVTIDDRVVGESIQWSITQEPNIELIPQDPYWAVSPATASAHFEADVVRLSDGVAYREVRDIPFSIDGTIDILPDGTASILIGSPMLEQ